MSTKRRGKDLKPGMRRPTPASWAKGRSGNPGGKPAKIKELTELCQTWGLDIAEKWMETVRAGREGWLECSKLLMAYGYGFPKQGVTVGADENAKPMSFAVYTGCPPPPELAESAAKPDQQPS